MLRPVPVHVFVVDGARLAGVRPATVRARARRLLAALGRAARTLNVVLVDDAEMRRLNRAHRRIDRPTDVLSFPMDGGPPAPGVGRAARGRAPAPLGDVVLNLDAVRRQARDRGGWARAHAGRAGRAWSALAEATLLLVHGVLHVEGHDHRRAAEARRMRAEERRRFEQLTQRKRSKTGTTVSTPPSSGSRSTRASAR
jgi:probable rRNA maturation factor